MNDLMAFQSTYCERVKSPYVNDAVRASNLQPNLQPTARELEVLQLICDGCTTKEIAARLGISFKTASSHRANLMEKAGVHSSIALFRWALTSGLVSCELGKSLGGQDSSGAGGPPVRPLARAAASPA